MGEAGEWHWSKPGLIAMAYLTVASSCLAYTAFAWLAKNTTPAMVGTYSYVNPAIAAVLGWWFLDEQLGANQLTGMAMMFAGVALVSWPQKRREAARRGSAEGSVDRGLRLSSAATCTRERQRAQRREIHRGRRRAGVRKIDLRRQQLAAGIADVRECRDSACSRRSRLR